MNINILEVLEGRQPKAGNIWSEEYKFIYSGTSVENPGMEGVSVMLGKDIRKKVKSYVQNNDRIILVNIETKSKDTIKVQVYMPTSNNNDS